MGLRIRFGLQGLSFWQAPRILPVAGCFDFCLAEIPWIHFLGMERFLPEVEIGFAAEAVALPEFWKVPNFAVPHFPAVPVEAVFSLEHLYLVAVESLPVILWRAAAAFLLEILGKEQAEFVPFPVWKAVQISRAGKLPPADGYLQALVSPQIFVPDLWTKVWLFFLDWLFLGWNWQNQFDLADW